MNNLLIQEYPRIENERIISSYSLTIVFDQKQIVFYISLHYSPLGVGLP